MESEQNVTSHPLWIHISWNLRLAAMAMVVPPVHVQLMYLHRTVGFHH